MTRKVLAKAASEARGRVAPVLAVLAWLTTLGLGIAPGAVRAEGLVADSGDPAYLSLGAGYFDVVRDDDAAADFRLEYRHDQRVLLFKPWAGLELTSDGGLWGGGGVLLDLDFGRRLVVTGSAGVGGYEAGNGKDLGATIEFRSQIELAYRFDDHSRLGLAFGHISNAGIGEENPGTEIATIYYHVPIGRLSELLR